MLPILDSTHSKSLNCYLYLYCHCFDLSHRNPPLLIPRPQTDSSHAESNFPSSFTRNPPSRLSCFSSPNYSIHSANVTQESIHTIQPAMSDSFHPQSRNVIKCSRCKSSLLVSFRNALNPMSSTPAPGPRNTARVWWSNVFHVTPHAVTTPG